MQGQRHGQRSQDRRQDPGQATDHGGVDAESGLFVAITRWETREQAEALRDVASEAFVALQGIGAQLEPPQFFEETVTG
jgi:hypothetical protein